jgi:hypothetical protein
MLFLLLAAASLHFDITDGRGRKPAGVTIEAGRPDAEGWFPLTVSSKGKGEWILIWPYDGTAKAPDGPEGIPAVVLERGDVKAVSNPRIAALLSAGSLLGVDHGLKASVDPGQSEDPFVKGVGLLAAGKAEDAVEPLARALKERERQLTRMPSEIYPAAMLYGKALMGANKFDDAAVAFLKALGQRPSDLPARRARAEALIKAGKPEAAEVP